MMLWRSVAPIFTGTNYTLLHFVNIRFYVITNSLKRLWELPIANLVHPMLLCFSKGAPVNKLQEKRP